VTEKPVGEQFTRIPHDFGAKPVMMWGTPLMVYVHKPHRTWKFGAKAFLAMYLGFPEEAIKQGILVYNPATKRVVLCRTYRILDAVPADWTPVNAPLPRFIPGSVETETELEEYLANMDPDTLPYDVCEEDDNAAVLEGFQGPVPTVREVPDSIPVAPAVPTVPNAISQRAAKFGVSVPAAAVVQPPIPVRPVPAPVPATPVQQPIPVALRPIPGLVQEVPNDGRGAVSGGGAVVQPTRLSYDKVCIVPNDSRDRRDDDELDYLLPDVWRLHYVFVDERKYRKRVHRRGQVYLSQLAKKKPKRVQPDADHPTMKSALTGPYEPYVRAAIEREYKQYVDTFQSLHIFTEEEMHKLRTAGYNFKHALTSHMDIVYKRDPVTNAFVDVKARLCVHGNQTDKYDFQDIKSPTVRSVTVKLLLSILAKVLPRTGKTFTARTFDCKGAFLQTSIAAQNAAKAAEDPNFVPEEPIVVRLPDGRYGVLLAYAYGLKQASREFQLKNERLLIAAGYLRTPDQCLFVKVVGDDRIYVSLHVDDFLSVATCDALHDELDALLTAEYKTLKRGVGPRLTYLGMVIDHLPCGDVEVRGPATVADIKATFQSTLKPVDDYPMHANAVHLDGDAEPIDATVFRKFVGMVNYYQLIFRPDLAYLVSIISSAMSAPTFRDWRVAERGFRYIMGTAENCCIRFHRDDDFSLHAWADASFQSREAGRSQTGYCFSLGKENGMFHSKSQKQSGIPQSSTEAEYIALYHCGCEAKWLRELLIYMFLPQPSSGTVLYQDNTSTIHWALGLDNFHNTKHVDRKYHYIRELWATRIIDIRYCPTKSMIADILTKPLIKDEYIRLRDRLLGLW
jgi:hypothetical protein